MVRVGLTSHQENDVVQSTKQYTMYYIEIEQNNRKYGFSGRFSALRKYHQLLKENLTKNSKNQSQNPLSFPMFPSRKSFRNMKKSNNLTIREQELFD